MYMVKISEAPESYQTIQAAAQRISIATGKSVEHIGDMFELRAYAERCGLDRIESVWVRN
jgi:hypothetical protein